MLDCGIHPGFSGLASLPFYDEVDMETVDVMLVTHFHLDHCAAVPYVVGHTSFRGRIFMTHPTKAIVHTLLKDFVKVSRGASGACFLWRGGAGVWRTGISISGGTGGSHGSLRPPLRKASFSGRQHTDWLTGLAGAQARACIPTATWSWRLSAPR